MARARSAVSLGVSALIVIIVIFIVGFGVYLNDTFDATSTTNTTNVGIRMISFNTTSAIATTTITCMAGETTNTACVPCTPAICPIEPPASFSTSSTATTSTSPSTTQTSCSQQYAGGIAPPDVPKISSSQDSSFSICARLYYYNSTATESFNTSSILVAGVGGITSNETLYPPKLDFGVSASPSALVMGGPSNLNEGTFVLFTMTTGDTSNGTYIVYFLAPLYPSLEICNQFTQFIVSNPNPFYAANPSCTAPLSNDGYTTNSQGFVDGYLTVQVIGMSNSTVATTTSG